MARISHLETNPSDKIHWSQTAQFVAVCICLIYAQSCFRWIESVQHAGKIEVLLIIGIICFAIGLPAFCVEPLVFISCLGKAHPPTLCNESEPTDHSLRFPSALREYSTGMRAYLRCLSIPWYSLTLIATSLFSSLHNTDTGEISSPVFWSWATVITESMFLLRF